MKHLRLTSLLLLLALVFNLSSCDKKEDPPTSSNKFFAKVNGIDYQPAFINGFHTTSLQTLLLSGSMGDGEEIQMQIPVSLTPGSYAWGDPNGPFLLAFYQRSDVDQDFAFANSGVLTIISHDKTQMKISGTFSFTTDSFLTDGSVFQITEGSFEITYTEI